MEEGRTLPDDSVFLFDLRTGEIQWTDRTAYIAQSAKCSADKCPCKWIAACIDSPPPSGFLHVFFENEQGFIASLLEDPRTKKRDADTFPMYVTPAPKQGGLN